MTDKAPYTYVVLRYVHDTATAEFVNVGVVLSCPNQCYLDAKLRHTYGRLSALFSGFDSKAFKGAMLSIERALKSVGKSEKNKDLFQSPKDAASLARSVLPSDDSSLQWSPLGSGLTANPQEQLERLFHRLVDGHDAKSEHRRTDADIWRPVRERLDQENLASKLSEKIIRSSVDELEFKHAWKNSIWHCYEALSFDLADSDGIRQKARRWTGHLTAIRDTSDTFKPYFIVGAPSDERLKAAFNDALAILKKSPVETEIFPEADVDTLVDLIVSEVASHD